MVKPAVSGDEDKDEDLDHQLVEVMNLGFIPKAWAASFLDQCLPCQAYDRYKRLITMTPTPVQAHFHYMEAWLKPACLQGSAQNDDAFPMRGQWGIWIPKAVLIKQWIQSQRSNPRPRTRNTQSRRCNDFGPRARCPWQK
jgi:hypothetical protein